MRYEEHCVVVGVLAGLLRAFALIELRGFVFADDTHYDQVINIEAN